MTATSEENKYEQTHGTFDMENDLESEYDGIDDAFPSKRRSQDVMKALNKPKKLLTVVSGRKKERSRDGIHLPRYI